MSLNIGDQVPEFELYNHDKTKYSDKDFLGQKTMFVFMPFPFSSVCDKEICELRDYQESFMKEDTNTVLGTVGASPTNRAWAEQYDIEFPILSDFWPHGEAAKKFGCFHDGAGISLRYTFTTNEENAKEIERLLLHQTKQPLYRYFENGRHVFEFSFKENPFCMHLEPLTDYGAGRA